MTLLELGQGALCGECKVRRSEGLCGSRELPSPNEAANSTCTLLCRMSKGCGCSWRTPNKCVGHGEGGVKRGPMTSKEGIHGSLHVRSSADGTITRRFSEKEARKQAQHEAGMRTCGRSKEAREEDVPAL